MIRKKAERKRLVFFATLGLSLNILFALGNLLIGIYEQSLWFINASAYYTILAVMRFAAVMTGRNEKVFIKRFSGVMLIGLSVVLAGTVYLSIKNDIANEIHEIAMITIATYTFTRLTITIIKAVKARKKDSPLLTTLRNISLCDAAVSIYSMQRSMLVSFEGMTAAGIRLMNALTGAGICIFIAVMGIIMIRRKKMAKSKIVKTTEKIAETVTEGFGKMTDGVVAGYEAIEKGVVEGYTKIEDKFVDRYLTKEGETVEQAKERLKNK